MLQIRMPYKPVQEDATLNLKLSPETQYEIGLKYYNGEGVTQDFRKAAKCFRLAADKGFPDAQNRLGTMYQYGRGVHRLPTEAVKWYRLAADQGNADAQNRLGTMYQYGRGVHRLPTEAVKWYRLAADQGNADAQNNLGVMYSNGRVRQNYDEAVKWYNRLLNKAIEMLKSIWAIGMQKAEVLPKTTMKLLNGIALQQTRGTPMLKSI